MCGIVGYVGKRPAAPLLLEGLSKLEYRGYDSAGLAVREGQQPVRVMKAKGRLAGLREKSDDGRLLPGSVGIGHTRWATHGEPSECNAHPHLSPNAAVVGVHNGIIENYQELKEKLEGQAYTFCSATDTEVLINLIDYYYKKYAHTPIDAINHALVRCRGSYALALMFADEPDALYVAKKDSPLIIGVTEDAAFAASDVPAILQQTRQVYYLGENESARLTANEVQFFDLNGDKISKELVEIKWDAAAAEKAGYEHFMMKEIDEQDRVVAATLNSLQRDGRIDLRSAGITADDLRRFDSVCCIGCGSAYHVGVVAQYELESLAQLPTRVELASEFRYRHPLLRPSTLVIIVSQSGETADSLAALREAKRHGCTTLAIVNVVGSTIAREANRVLYTLAGPEIAVATTKAYSCQLAAVYCLALAFAEVRGSLSPAESTRLLTGLNALPAQIRQCLSDKTVIQRFSAQFVGTRELFLIGRGLDYAVSLEGSLKIKEISYIHAEAYAAGELKHGTLSLIEAGTPVIGLLTQDELYEKTLSNLVECKSRGAYLFGIGSAAAGAFAGACDQSLILPPVDPHFAPSLAILPLQLLGYQLSIGRGLDVDKPRNLAKSVTVE